MAILAKKLKISKFQKIAKNRKIQIQLKHVKSSLGVILGAKNELLPKITPIPTFFEKNLKVKFFVIFEILKNPVWDQIVCS